MKIVFDDHLKQKLLIGDKDAFEQTVELCKNLVYANAWSILKNKHDAEDITQDVFTLLFKKVQTLNPATNIPAWLYVTTIFMSKKFLRDQKIKNKHEKEKNKMNDVTQNKDELKEIILHEISSLSSKYRDVLFRHYILEEKYTEIADNLGVNLSTVSMQIKRGLEQLRLNLGKKGYVVTSAVLVSIATNLNNVQANCALTSNAIANSAFSSTNSSFKLYNPKYDSKALRAFRENESVSLFNYSKIFFIITPFVLFFITLYFLSKSQNDDGLKLSSSNIDNISKEILLKKELFQTKIWNSQNQNFNEIINLSGEDFLKEDLKTQESYIGYSGNGIDYYSIPGKITKTPTKVTIQAMLETIDNASIGVSLFYEKKIPRCFRSISKTLYLKPNSNFIQTFYLIENALIQTSNDTLVSMNAYQNNIENYEILINNKNVKIIEIRMEQMDEKEIELANKMILETKNLPKILSDEQELPKYINNSSNK